MRKLIIISVLMFVFVLSGCNDILTKNTNGIGNLKGNKPPKVIIEIDGETYETVLGSYCWNSNGKGKCIDTAGPGELLKDKEPIQVQAGDKVTVKMDYTPQPNETHLSREKNGKERKIEVNNNQFMIPDEKGVYYYAYSVWWMDEKEEDLSHGDAFYAFVLEVN